MSTERNAIPEVPNNPEVGVTSFHGGARGQCIQLTQGVESIQLTKEQARHAIVALQNWLWDKCE
jgi:hypothetical protein